MAAAVLAPQATSRLALAVPIAERPPLNTRLTARHKSKLGMRATPPFSSQSGLAVGMVMPVLIRIPPARTGPRQSTRVQPRFRSLLVIMPV